MKKIPNKARPMIDYIRKNVSRPSLDSAFLERHAQTTIRFNIIKFGWETRVCCPMGLIKEAYHPTPYAENLRNGEGEAYFDLSGFDHEFLKENDLLIENVNAFADWWDSQKNIKVAMRKVWG